MNHQPKYEQSYSPTQRSAKSRALYYDSTLWNVQQTVVLAMLVRLFCFLLLASACWTAQAADGNASFTCSLCPGGADPATPDRVYHLGDSSAGSTSCRDMIAAAASASEESCLGTVTWSNTLDWPSFCGCPGFDPQYICGDYCWDHNVSDAPLPSDIATNANCLDFAGYYPYLLDETQCGGERLKEACCVNGLESSASKKENTLLVPLLLQSLTLLACLAVFS